MGSGWQPSTSDPGFSPVPGTAAVAARADRRTDRRMTDAPRGRLLGIDHGAKVIGLAICDAMWIAARPLALLHREARTADFAQIQAIIEREDIAGIVLGLPETPEDFNGISQADTVRRWGT